MKTKDQDDLLCNAMNAKTNSEMRSILAGVEVNTPDEDGDYPLHKAGGSIIGELLRLGADPNVKDSDGCTPLFMIKNFDSLECLISAGADVHARDRWGQTALHVCRVGDFAFKLVCAGADPNTLDDDDISCWDQLAGNINDGYDDGQKQLFEKLRKLMAKRQREVIAQAINVEPPLATKPVPKHKRKM